MLLLSWFLDVAVGCFHGNFQKLWTLLSSLHPSSVQTAHNHRCLLMDGLPPRGGHTMVRRCIVLDYREHCGLRRTCEFIFQQIVCFFWQNIWGNFWRNMYSLVLSWLILLIFGEKWPFFISQNWEKNSRVKVILGLGLTLLTHPHFLASRKAHPPSEKLSMNSQIGFFSNQVSLSSFLISSCSLEHLFLHITYRAINQELHHLPPSTHKRRIKWLVSN